VTACPSCGRDVAEGFAFCPYCGAAVAAASEVEERKLVTVLFADVSGSTHLAETLDAEVVRDLMAGYFAVAREEIEAHGGTLEKFIGDAVMAVFGVPAAHEDDPARALHAALGIRRRLAELNVRRRSEGGPELEVRIGVNSGEVVSTGATRPGEVMVTGDAVNVAARLQQLAAPGQILVGGRTAAAAPEFRYAAADARAIRGKADSVEVAELLGAGAASAGARRTHLRAPLVGREEELALLGSIYDRVAREGRPHLVTVYGQPGVGKSRLTAELLDALGRREPPPRVVRGRCLSYGSGVTFWPLAEILKGEAGIADGDAPGEAVAKLEALAERLGAARIADAKRTTALLGSTVGIRLPGYDFDRLDPETLRAEILEAWRSFFSAIAEREPIVAVIEDIHWAEPALLDILSDLGARVQGRVLFLCPARPDLVDRSPTWGGGRPSFSAIFLDPLDRDHAARLVDFLLEVEELPGDLRDRVVERAGGNPFFAEEIVRHLVDRRGEAATDPAGGGSDVSAIPIPDTVQAVIAARIDLLPPDEKRALQAAAVVGRIFWPDPVARYLDVASRRVTDLLRGLEARDLVLSRLDSSMRGQQEFIFKHALVRDVAYESIPRRDRAMAHLEIVRWIEGAIGERRLEVVELLAHHYTAAQRAAAWGRVEPDRQEEIRSRAVALLFDAADEAGRLFAMERAMERVTTGLELARGPIERSRGLEALSRLALWRDDGDTAWRAAREAVELRMAAPGPVDRRAMARLCGWLLAMPTRWPGLLRTLPSREESEPYLELGFSMLDPGDSEERIGLLLAKGAWGWGFAEADRDPVRTRAYREAVEEAIQIAERMGRPDLLSAALDTAGAACQDIGGYALANTYQLRRLDLVPELDDPSEIADIIGTLAWHYVHIGEYRKATELEPTAFTTRHGLKLPDISHRTKLSFNAVALYRMGDWDGFWRAYETIDATIDHELAITYHLMRLFAVAAYLHDVAGDEAAADRLIEELDRSQATRGDTGVSSARLWIVDVLVRRGRLEEARRRLAIPDPSRDLQNLDLTHEAWAELLAEEGAWSEAPAIIAAARAWATQSGLLALPAFADRLEGRMLVATGDSEAGVERLRAARATLDGLEAAWDRARTELDLADALLRLDNRTEAAEVADAALATLERLSAPREIARARDLRSSASR
jgi:class 3 adenylate cyclase/tetratricopeptide (TPR) repeat protein